VAQGEPDGAYVDRYLTDRRLDITIAFGYDKQRNWHNQTQLMASKLLQSRFSPVNHRRLRRIGVVHYHPFGRYFAKRFRRHGKDMQCAVCVLDSTANGQPYDGLAVRRGYVNALKNDEIVIYTGHGRFGTEPGFRR
jgi:hypothetical protein